MKRFICPLAPGLLYCTAFARPASATVTTHVDSITLVFTDTAGSSATATSLVKWGVNNGDSNAFDSNMLHNIVYVTSTTSEYVATTRDVPKTTPANSNEPYNDTISGTVYPAYAYDNKFRAKGLLTGTGTIAKPIETTKAF